MDQIKETETQINEEIIRRAVKRSGFKENEKEKLLRRQDVIDALEESTELPLLELEQIAREVRDTYSCGGKEFFSIKHQILLAALMGCVLVSIILVAVWLF